MHKDKVVIIGAIAAGGSAAFKVRRLNPSALITVVEADRHFSYAACGLPYFISGVINDHRKMVMRGKKDFQEANINLLTGRRAVELNPAENEITITPADGALSETVNYDKLLISTGAEPIIPPIEGCSLDGVYTLRTLQHGLDLKKALRTKNIEKTVIIGGSYIGLELAEAFKTLGLEVRLIEKMPDLMNTFDRDMALHMEKELAAHDVMVHAGETLTAFEGDSRGVLKSVVTDRASYKADLAVIALGVKPNSSLAASAGIRLGTGGAIAVNRYLQTSVENIYAAGDCAEAYHMLLDKNVYIPLGTTANKQGRLAGENICGQNSSFPGVLGSAVIKVFNISAGRTGLTEKEAEAYGFPCRSVMVETLDQAAYYPGAVPLYIKLIFNPVDGRLLGGQTVGSLKSVKRVDSIATAVSAGLTVSEFSSVDMAYSPPFSRVWEGLTVAANAAENLRVKGGTC